MCKRNSLHKNEASMGCVRETPHIKNEASTGYVTETLQVEYFYLFLKRRKKKLKGKKATTKKEKKDSTGSVREIPCVKVKTARGFNRNSPSRIYLI